MAGVLLVVMGLSRLGGAVKFIPYPVTAGFTSGIAVVIFSGQINDLFGLGLAKIPARISREVDRLFPEPGGDRLE